ncbi:sugar transporter-like protein [Aspergillus vadensis CBS 113365]|uniref:General substrate transporter n=1 Tax=Aspergillus vadensis (strain CBS 113365 / IMI 142717 / IBT 24658) TaxID=1448311 RepID=A0A319C8P1_ASPVC|nr:general substrate transporter [Aspergillus vadensis CBS 113365]PYH74803.1 general substrate transporter [Aspergillus vadensis CBS 113365]
MVKINMYGRGLSLRLAIMFTCQAAFALFGYNQAVFSGIINNADFLAIVHHPTTAVMGIIVSIYNLGCLLGTAVAFLTSDNLGFRKSVWLAMCIIIIGATVQTSSYSKTQLLVSRLFTGIGIGIMTTTVPVYQAELCEARKRGMYVCTQPLAVGVGITIAYWYDYGMSYVDGPINWRLPIASQVIIAILVIILLLGLPENPRWLCRQHRRQEALQVLSDFYDLPLDHPTVTQEAENIFRAIDDGRPEYKWSEIFKKDELHTGRRILLAYGLQFTNQMGGAPLIVVILEDNVGLDAKLSLLLSGVIQLMFVIGAFYPIFYSDRLGRRSPMMWGSFGLFVCLLMISILLSFKGTNLEKSAATASVAFFFLYMLIYGATINCIPWVYGPELLPQHVRTKGQAIGISANWLWSFFVNMISPTLIRDLAWKGYLIFVAFNLVFIPIVYFYYPETANLSLEDIDSLFGVQKAQPIREDDKGFTWVETRPVS